MRRGGAVRAGVALVACAALAPLAARADGVVSLGGGAALVDLSRGPFTGSGGGLLLVGRYVLSDQFDARVEVGQSFHTLTRPPPDPCPDAPEPCEAFTAPSRYSFTTATAGLTYKLDTTRVSPNGGLLIGISRLAAGETNAASLWGSRGDEQKITITPALGVDWRVSPALSLGVAGRYHIAPGSALTTALALDLRVERVF